jgi:hypothetical protein
VIAWAAVLECRVAKTMMPGEGGFSGDFCCFSITNFTNQDCIGILSHQRTQNRREAEIDIIINLTLSDSFELNFDRILNRRYVDVGSVYLVKSGIKSRRFPEPVGPVTKMMPLGFLMSRLNGSRMLFDIIILSRVTPCFL